MAEKPVVVLYPSAGIGHLISMVELAKLLLTQLPSLSITILTPTFPFNTGSYSSYISTISTTFTSITFHSLPSVSLIDDPSNYADIEQIAFEILRNCNPNIRHFLNSLPSPPIAFILDFFCYPAMEISRSLNIPSFFFFTSGAAALALFLNFPAFDEIAAGESLRNLWSKLLEIPGLFAVPASQMIEPMLDRDGSYGEFVRMGAELANSDGIVVNTFDSLELRGVRVLKEGVCLKGARVPPIYTIGPLIANCGEGGGDEKERHECLSWLDSQPSRSVVYLGFGSRGTFTKEQIREIASALEKSGVRFLWVIRATVSEDKGKEFLPPPDPDLDTLLPVGFLGRTRDRGLVVKSWAPQIEVLNHEAIGGFVTHCGWNSVLEAVSAGVPMVAWPLYAEQRFNKIALVDEMRIALPMNESEDRFVSSNEIEKRVKQIMGSDEGEAVRKRVLGLKDKAKAALSEGGSSKAAVAMLVESWKR